jgi:hypothetical protein
MKRVTTDPSKKLTIYSRIGNGTDYYLIAAIEHYQKLLQEVKPENSRIKSTINK